VSIVNLTSRAIMIIAMIPALAESNVLNPFQIRAPALSTTLSRDFWSKRFIMEMLLPGMLCPIAPPAMIFYMELFSTGNMMWLRRRSRSLVEEIPLVARDAGFTYFQVGRVRG